ncbi:MAG: acetylglutamate kinase [Chloroflexota bacterium]
MTEQLVVVKIGGSTLGRNDTSLADFVALQHLNRRIVVVHGGGGEVNRWLSHLGYEARFVNGLRVTGAQELDVVAAVLSGLVNKRLVLALNAAGGRAVGLSGVDAGFLHAQIEDESLGYVGTITRVEPAVVTSLLDDGFLPVVSSICWGKRDGKATLLNVNADDVAVEIAAAAKATRLIYLTDVPGIMDNNKDVLGRLTTSQVRELIASGIIAGGMVPKARACMAASQHVAETRIIDGTVEHALLREFDEGTGGTSVVRDELA